MPKTSPTAAATRQIFIDCFCELYASKPIDKITVAEISRKAGYNRQTFYEYFSSIYDLLERIEDELIDLIGEKIAATISVGQFTDLFLMAFSEMQSSTEKYAFTLLIGDQTPQFQTKLKKAVLPVIMASFHISPEDISAVYALDFYLSGMLSMLSDWHISGRELSIDEMAVLVRTILTQGVLKAIGQAL